jgi:hypothetical protein
VRGMNGVETSLRSAAAAIFGLVLFTISYMDDTGVVLEAEGETE